MPNQKQTRWMRFRMYAAIGTLVVFGGLLLFRFWTLQVVQSDWLEGLARQQYLKEISLVSMRGSIVDRNNSPLAISVMTESIYASPREVANLGQAASRLARALVLKSSVLYKRLSAGKHFVWIKRRVTPAEAKQVRQLDLKGIHFTRESRRYYPARELAGSVVGFAGDGQGLEGVELMFENELRGATVLAQGIRDARGNILFAEGLGDLDAAQGGSVMLTIDLAIQEIVETELMRVLTETRAKSATAIVLDPHTGEILAMANVPSFNPNTFWKSTPGRFRNRAIGDCYEPGSTFKVFTMAIALQGRQIGNHTRIDCGDGKLKVGGHVIHDPTRRSKGLMKPTDILVTSSNVGMAKIGMGMGKERLHDGLRIFGFGKSVGIDLPGEAGCVLRKPHSEIGLATISFGQGVSVTPLQLITALGAVANGGVWMRPLIVKQIQGLKGEVWKRFDPEPAGRVMEMAMAKKLTEMMTKVIEPGGTGHLAAVDGFRVAGKTGTAQKADPIAGGYSKDKSVASFMGFVPARQPRIAILVVVDEPATESFGSIVAAPVFSKIAEATLRYLKVFSNHPKDLIAQKPRSIAERKTPHTGSKVVFVETVDRESSAKEGQLPDLSGVSLREALKVLSDYGLEVFVKGSGRVVSQLPPPKTSLSSSARVTLVLERSD